MFLSIFDNLIDIEYLIIGYSQEFSGFQARRHATRRQLKAARNSRESALSGTSVNSISTYTILHGMHYR